MADRSKGLSGLTALDAPETEKPAEKPAQTKKEETKKDDAKASDGPAPDSRKSGVTDDGSITVDAGTGSDGKTKQKYPVCKTFDDMNLRDELLRGIYAHGFENPSPIQQRAILPILDGNDTIAQAQSGTGKTATFAISVLQKIKLDNKMCQALVLAPTRELAQQIR